MVFRPADWQPGVTFELGVYSPSDCQHTFSDFNRYFDMPFHGRKDLDGFFRCINEGLANRRLGGLLNDPHHAWVDGRRIDVALEPRQRITGTFTVLPNAPGFSPAFPKVQIVSDLLIRRRFYRKIAVTSLRDLLRDAFPCLHRFRHEMWHDVNPNQQLSNAKGKLI